MFNALNCTSGVLGRKLLLFHAISKHKLICVCVCVCVCVCMTLQKKYITLMFLRAYRAAELPVNTRKDNIDIDIKRNSVNDYVDGA